MTFKFTESETNTLVSNYENLLRPVKRRKIIVIGASNTGKTSLLSKFSDDVFIDYYEPTIHHIVKHSIVINNSLIEIEFVDIEGLSEFSIISSNAFAFGISGYLLIYSTTDKKSFRLLKTLNEKIIAITNSDIPRMVVGTKNDLDKEREITSLEAKMFANSIKCPFMETSAKNGKNVQIAIKLLLCEINRYENNFDISRVKCLALTRYIIRNEQFLILIYFLQFTIFTCGIMEVLFGIKLGTSENNFDKIYYLCALLCGLWGILFSIFGIVGVKKENGDVVKINKYGNYFQLIYNIGRIAASIGFYKDEVIKNTDETILLSFLAGHIIVSGLIVFFDIVIEDIYCFNLELYIA